MLEMEKGLLHHVVHLPKYVYSYFSRDITLHGLVFFFLLKAVVLQEATSNFNFAMAFDLIAFCDH